MVLTTRTHTTLFNGPTDASTKKLIRLPLSIVPHYEQRCSVTGAIMPTSNKMLFRTNLWSSEEHERFLHGLEIFPNGPWKDVAKVVGTKTTRQTMTHAQKYRQKIERRMAAKPKQSTTKSRRRCVHASPDLLTPSPGDQQQGAVDSFAMALAESKFAVASPADVHSNAFESSFLDYELDSLLCSLELPLTTIEPYMFPTPSYPDELGVFIV